MTVPAAIRLLVVTADSMFADYTLAAVDKCRDLSARRVSRLPDAQAFLDDRPVDCVVLDDELSERHNRAFHRLLRHERPELPVVLAADCPRAALPASLSYHAFVRKGGPSMGTALSNVVRILATARPLGDHGTPPAAAD